jgi:branched-subunit amino acid transport protein
MRFIPTRIHGILDYLYAIALFCAPFLFWTTDRSWDLWIPMLVASVVILYSILTRYEWGGISLISMKSHLRLDLIIGIFMVAAPWIFGFSDRAWRPFLIFGLLAIILSFITKKTTTHRVLGVGHKYK